MANPDANFPIQVDEDAHTVVVQGGVQTRVLLDFLANYMYALHLWLHNYSLHT